MISISTIVKFTALGLLSLTNTHPGEEEYGLIPHHAKREFLSRLLRSLDSCAKRLGRRGIYKTAEARRKTFAEEHSKRSFETRVRESEHENCSSAAPAPRHLDPDEF